MKKVIYGTIMMPWSANAPIVNWDQLSPPTSYIRKFSECRFDNAALQYLLVAG